MIKALGPNNMTMHNWLTKATQSNPTDQENINLDPLSNNIDPNLDSSGDSPSFDELAMCLTNHLNE